MTLRTGSKRPGLTLLEVIVAVTIFFMSVVAIFHLMLLGTGSAEEVRMQTRTSLRCQSKLAEYIAGIESVDNTNESFVPFGDSDQDLQWKSKASRMDEDGFCWQVEVWVKGQIVGGNLVESYLCQYVIDAQKYRGTTFDPAPQPQEGTPTPDSPEAGK
ncbi:MAG: hypothetical protein FJ303_11160 [Planctomycetes bacterium]|nr:hypothetical protein [Planctomycetota bacterium]